MPDFKLLSLGADGEVIASRMFRCEHKADALKLAGDMTRGHARIQVWADDKFIGEAAARLPGIEAVTSVVDPRSPA